MNKKLILSPSALSCDFSHLGEDIGRAEQAGVEYLHLDVMDGVFVPNISFGPCVISSIRPCSGLVFDVHLMITDPIRYISQFVKSGADIITVHVEATDDPAAALSAIREAGVKTCISIKPATPVEAIRPYLHMLDMVLVMSVEPGFGGQKFMPDTLEHVRELVRLREELSLDYDIEIDGGINRDNIRSAVEAGVNVVVAGSAIFGKDDIGAAVRELREAAAL